MYQLHYDSLDCMFFQKNNPVLRLTEPKNRIHVHIVMPVKENATHMIDIQKHIYLLSHFLTYNKSTF
jgi:hypothetical protein